MTYDLEDSGVRGSSPNPSGATHPVWYHGSAAPPAPPFEGPLRADVCVIGAGIAGLSCAERLTDAGKSVIVVDEKGIGAGETGRTSAHLASALDDRFKHLESRHGIDSVRLAYQSHNAAIDHIERTVKALSIACGFARVDGLLFAGDESHEDDLDAEYEAAHRAGAMGIEMVQAFHGSPLSPRRRYIRFPRQARFEPIGYLRGLADALTKQGVRFLTGVRVSDLSGDGPVTAKLADGRAIAADFGIAATNVPTPINNWMGVYTKQAAYRSYVIALEAGDDIIDALYWDMLDPYHYVRLARVADRSVLVVGGEDHKVGQHGQRSGADRFVALETWAREQFPSAGTVVARWSGQVAEPEDGLAYIGRAPTGGHKACYVITGDSGMGLTHGVLGALITTDLIVGRRNPFAELYDPSRKPWTSPIEYAKENLNAAAQFADYAKPGEVASAEDIVPGSGAVMREGLSRLAVYRDEAGAVHTCSAVCPHLKCVVRWNDTEKSWDCPCHGSRFDAHGKMIIGPAIDDLPAREAPTS